MASLDFLGPVDPSSTAGEHPLPSNNEKHDAKESIVQEGLERLRENSITLITNRLILLGNKIILIANVCRKNKMHSLSSVLLGMIPYLRN